MKIIRTARAMQRIAARLRAEGKTIGLVPTMGALHAGHRSLIRAARRRTDAVIVSLFVNPLQFGPTEDFRRYPRAFAADARLCRAEGAGWLFAPSATEVYPAGFETSVAVERLSRLFCGKARLGHFRGVTTVVMKLLCLIQPGYAFFGRKDYQQFVIVTRMIRDLGLPVTIVVCPTVREPDGLACSSRNRYLNAAERRAAPALYAALQDGARLIRVGEVRAQRIIAAMRRHLSAADRRVRPVAGHSDIRPVAGHSDIRVDYLAVVEPGTLEAVRQVTGPVVLLGAVWAGTTRLIDNLTTSRRGLKGTTSRTGSR